jgi:hypothetical protein
VGRKKSAPPSADQGPANPLLRMLGTFFRLERSALKAGSKAIAKELGLTDTYYRLVESGRASLNQAMAVKLTEVLADRRGSQSITPSQIHFQRLAVFLVGTQLVGSSMLSAEDTDADRLAMEALAERDADFELFHRRTRGYYSLPEGEPRLRFLEDEAVPEVRRFLSKLTYAEPPELSQIVEDVLPAKDILALPSANVEMLVRLAADLTDRPFVHTRHVAAKWEERHARIFVRCRGVYEKAQLILAQENLDQFNYLYLSEESFKEERFLFLDPGEKDATKAALVGGLNRAREKAGRPPVSDTDKDKIHVAHLPASGMDAIRDQIRSLCTVASVLVEEEEYQAFWSFETSLNIPIGFVGRNVNKTLDVLNLSLAASVKREREFDLIWSEIVAS